MEGVLFFLLYDFFVSFLFSMNLTKLHHRTYEFSLDFRNSLKCYKSLSAKITYENCSSTFHVIDNYKTGTFFSLTKKIRFSSHKSVIIVFFSYQLNPDGLILRLSNLTLFGRKLDFGGRSK